MKNVVAGALVVCVSAVALAIAQTPTPGSVAPKGTVLRANPGPTATPAPNGPSLQGQPKGPGLHASGDVAAQREWVNKYWVSCHNTKTALPANDPVKLDTASLDQVTKDAATWERVLRKLSVRAMPPSGTPHPSELEYAGFTRWLAASLDRGWASRQTPGRYVVHRLNRAE